MTPTAYGFIDLQDLYTERITVVGVARVYKAVQESADEYTRIATDMMAEFAERTTVAAEQIELAGDGTLQPLDENGNPLPVAPSGSYQVAYPIQGAGTAWGTDRVSRALMTVEEANRNTLDSFQRDADWLIRHMLAAIIDNVAWTYKDKVGPNGAKGLGNITIQPLANGDAVTYPRMGGGTPATDDHYLAQAAGIADATNPFPTIQAELHEHPSNLNGRILVYAASGLVPSIRALTAFVGIDDPNVSLGANSDVATNVPSAGPGGRVIGYIKGTSCWIIEFAALPAGIMIAKIEGKAILKNREYGAPELQGFFPEFANVDGNHQINRMLRYGGFGVSDRVGALVFYVGNSSYQLPAAFDAPLAV